MSHIDMISYKRVGKRPSYACRGFRLHPRRLSVQKLRAKFLQFFRMFNRLWRTSYGQALWSVLKKGHANVFYRSKSRRMMEKPMIMSRARGDQHYCGRLRSFGRSNSFHSEAIADCLEFIKRTSISLDQNPVYVNKLER